ncbi:MAG: MMPL family transporter [Thermoplasmatales archaeon]
MLERQFGSLGKIIKKRYKIIIALWLIALVIFLPFAAKSASVTNYNVELTGVSKNSMATEAQSIMNKEFNKSNATGNGTVLVLYFASPFGSSESYSIWNYINSTYSEQLSGAAVKNATSAYPIANKVLNSLGNTTFLIIKEIYNASNSTKNSFLKFNSSLNSLENITQELRGADYAYVTTIKNVTIAVTSYSTIFKVYFNSLENASNLIYGIPLEFLSVYMQVSAEYRNLTPEEWNYISYKLFMNETGYLGNSSAPLSYFNSFYYAWNSSTSSQPEIAPLARLNSSIEYAFTAFSSYMNTSEKEIFGSVYDSLNVTSYSNSTIRRDILDKVLYNVTEQYGTADEAIFNATYYNFLFNGSVLSLSQNITGEIIEEHSPSISTLTQYLFNETGLQFAHSFTNLTVINDTFLINQISSSRLNESLSSLSRTFNISSESLYSSLLNNSISSLRPYFIDFAAKKIDPISSLVNTSSEDMVNYFISNTPYNSSSHFSSLFLENQFRGYPYFNIANPEKFVRIANASKGSVASSIQGNYTASGISFNSSLFSPLVPENLSGFMVLISFNSQSLNSSQLQIANSYISDLENRFSNVPIYFTSADEIAHGIEKTAYSGLLFSLVIGIIVSIFIVGIYFRSPILALVPFLFFAVSFGITLGITYLVFGIILKSSLSFIVTTLSSILILGLSTDYSVYMLNRYLKERSEDKLGSTMEWAGHAVFTSGLTVIISYTVLALFNVPIIGDGGFVNALGITISLGVALTLLPSFVYLFGPRIREKSRILNFRKVARVSRDHRKILVAVLVLLFIGAIVIYEITPTSFDLFSLVPNNQGKAGYYDIVKSYGADELSPAFIILNFTSPFYYNNSFNTSDLEILNNVSKNLTMDPSVSQIQTVIYPFGYKVNIQSLTGSSAAVNATINRSLTFIGKDRSTVLIYVYGKYVSYTQQGINSVGKIDQIMKNVVPKGVSYYIGGPSQDLIDSSQSITSSTYKIVEILGSIIFVVLALQLTSVFTPLRLLFNVGTSALVAVSLFYIVFYYVDHLPIIVFGPLFVIVTLFGVGLDYDIFLVTRAREAVMKGKSDEEAIEEAIDENASVVLVLGFILSGVFGSLIFSPIGIIKEIGFSITVGVLIDTLVSWLFLIPALMLVMKKYNWWPSHPGTVR